MKTSLRIMMIVGVPLGVLIIILRNFFHIDNADFLQYYLYASIALVIFVFMGAIYFQLKMNNEVLAAQKEYAETNDLDTYILFLRKWHKKTPIEQNRSILTMNIAIAYADKKRFTETVEEFEKIDLKSLSKDLIFIYYNNYVYYCFCAGQYDKAISIMEEQEGLFLKMAESNKFKGGYILNESMRLIKTGETTKALDLLDEHVDLFDNDQLSENYNFVLSLI